MTGKQNLPAVLALNLSENMCHVMKIRNSHFSLINNQSVSCVLMTIVNEVHKLTAIGNVTMCQKCFTVIPN